MEKDLLERLIQYCSADYVPMHMPGGKRNADKFQMPNPYSIDITEIDGFDNMHHAESILKEAFVRSARLFGAEETLFLVNGSSAGLLSAICGATKKGDTVLVARNCHRSVYNALYLNELNPVYSYPEELVDGIYGAVSPAQIEEKLLKNPQVRAVIITSPTYEGMISDIKKIAEIVHKYDKILIVDEAHGAHFAFHERFPESAVACGADAVIQSIHKTLPSLTQTALLHLQGMRIDRERVKRYWDMYQTTSPSYVLLSGIDRCMSILETQGKELFQTYVGQLMELREQLSRLKRIRLLAVDDISKIVLLTEDGKALYEALLKRYHIQLEMASLHYVIAMTSIGDTKEDYQRFYEALAQIDAEMDAEADEAAEGEQDVQSVLCQPHMVMNLYQALNSEMEMAALADSIGRTAGEGICFYPPGIPLVNPGEVLTEEIVQMIQAGLKKELEVIGVKKQEKGAYVLCLK